MNDKFPDGFTNPNSSATRIAVYGIYTSARCTTRLISLQTKTLDHQSTVHHPEQLLRHTLGRKIPSYIYSTVILIGKNSPPAAATIRGLKKKRQVSPGACCLTGVPKSTCSVTPAASFIHRRLYQHKMTSSASVSDTQVIGPIENFLESYAHVVREPMDSKLKVCSPPQYRSLGLEISPCTFTQC